MILAALYLLIAIGGAATVIRSGPLRAAAMLAALAAFWFALSILAFWLYNIILPLPSFAMLLFGAYAMGILASYWDIEPEEDPRQIPLDM